MKKLLIVGAGGHGRCCLEIARSMNKYDEINFLDDNLLDRMIDDCKVIGLIDEMSSYYIEYEEICIAIGNNKTRMKLSQQAKQIGFCLAVLVSPFSNVSSFAKIENGVVVFPQAVIESNAVIEEGSVICANVTVNHDALINAYCLVYSSTVVRANAVIGNLSRIGSLCTISSGTKLPKESIIEDGITVGKG